MRWPTRALRATVKAPALAGVVVVLGLVSCCDDAALGGAQLDAWAQHRFGSEISQMKIAVAATAIALGIAIGLGAGLLTHLRYSSTRLARRRTARALVENVFVCLAIESALVLGSMAESPQLYAARWYARGGLARTTQILATDVLGPAGVFVLAVAAALLYARPARLALRVRRALRSVVPRAALLLLVPALSPASAPAPDSAPAPAGSSPVEPGASRPNIVLLSIDSLRADRLDPRVAPALSALSARAGATRFDRAYVSLPRGLPSWVTLLTGRYAHHHGIRSMFPTREDDARDLDALPARLARAGYATAVVSDDASDVFRRVELGFASVRAPRFDLLSLVRGSILERETPLLPLLDSQVGRRLFPVMRDLREAGDPRRLAEDVAASLHALRASKKPFFLTVSFGAAGAPYAVPAPYYAKYTDSAYRGRFKYHEPFGAGADAPPDAADVTQIRALYDGAVSAVDAAVGRVLLSLEREGLAGDTVVVVTADHGEELYEDGRGGGHGDHLFGDEGTHVPLVVFDPRAHAAAARTASVVRDVDLAPTLYELAGVPAPSDLDGRSLVPALHGQALAPRFAYAETGVWFDEHVAGVPADLRIPYPGILALVDFDDRHGDAEMVLRREVVPVTLMARHRMIRDERWKLVYVPTRKGAKYMLFDTVADPGERRDRAAAEPAEVARLRAELWSWMLRDPRMEQRDGLLVPRPSAGATGLARARSSSSSPSLPAFATSSEAYEVAQRLVELAPLSRVDTAPRGGFDQRDALVAAPPTTFAFKLAIPRGAKLTFAEGTGAAAAATIFAITVIDAKGEAHEVYRHQAPPSASRRWTDASCDLGSFAGQTVELRLSTSTGSAAPARDAAPGASVALWGSPTLLTATIPRAPYNVLWIAVDSLRPDVVAPARMPGLTPAIDGLARRGVRFTRAYSAATSTRPATLAMLAGARASELGLGPPSWSLQGDDLARFYAAGPPLLPLMARRHGVATQAFVNDSFMAGDAPIGVDVGFDRVAVHRARTRDVRVITHDATAWIDAHRDTRFFLFVGYDPPREPPTAGASGTPDDPTRLYLARAARIDAAVDELLRSLAAAGLRERTIVVLTAAHGEALSPAHPEHEPARDLHAAGDDEATAHVPLLIVAPGILPEDRAVTARVRTTDVAPTVADLLGFEAHPRFSGRSLVALASGHAEPDERVVVTEGRGTHAVMHDRYRLVARDNTEGAVTANDELFDLEDDPGESHDLSRARPDLVAEMRARLAAALANTPVAGSAAAAAPASTAANAPVIRLRFAGGGHPRRISGTLTIGDPRSPSTKARSFSIEPVELGRDALRITGDSVEVSLTTSPAAVSGFDIRVDPPATPVAWHLYLDDAPWPEDAVFGGPYGLRAPSLREGITSAGARSLADAALMPLVDPRRDAGLFVVRARPNGEPTVRAPDPEDSRVMTELLRARGRAAVVAKPVVVE